MKTLILIIISLVTVSEVSRPRDIQEFDFNKKSEVVEFLSQFEQIEDYDFDKKSDVISFLSQFEQIQ